MVAPPVSTTCARRIDIRLRILDVLGVDLQVIERLGALGSPEERGDLGSIEVVIQHVVFRLLRRDQIAGRDVRLPSSPLDRRRIARWVSLSARRACRDQITKGGLRAV